MCTFPPQSLLCSGPSRQSQRKKNFQITGIEEWETIMASIQMPLEAEMQQKTEEDEMQTTATILTIENLD